jgi:hypothetical protein
VVRKAARGGPKARLAASSFRRVEWKDLEKRKKLFGGEKEQMVQVTLTFEQPPFVGFITTVEKRPQLEEIVAGLERARSG